MKKLMLLSSLLIAHRGHAMELSNASAPTNTSGVPAQTLAYHFCSLDNTRNEDDENKSVHIKRELFIHLVVEAAQAPLNKNAFQELITKIKTQEINTNNPKIIITQKDAKHRLLSYITSERMYSWVNGKLIELELLKKFKKREKQYPEQVGKIQGSVGWPAYRGNIELIETDQEKIVSNYKFAAHANHHAYVVAEFQKLIQQ